MQDDRLVIIDGVDLRDRNQADAAMRQAALTMGGIGGLINAAGGFRWTPVEQAGPADWDAMFAINLTTTLNATLAALPFLKAGRGRIVNIGAAAALSSGAGMAPYAASKSAVHRLTESLAAELKGEVAVNAVLPTIIDTPANRADMAGADRGGWLDPADIAATILFLVSGEARAINGALTPLR